MIINDTDKNVGPSTADATDVIKERRRQLYDTEVFKILTDEQVIIIVWEVQTRLRNIIMKYKNRGKCSQKEENFLLSN